MLTVKCGSDGVAPEPNRQFRGVCLGVCSTISYNKSAVKLGLNTTTLSKI